MATDAHTRCRFLLVYTLAVAALSAFAVALSFTLSPERRASAPPTVQAYVDTDDVSGAPDLDSDELGLVGFAGKPIDSKKPKLTAYLTSESYTPGSTAQLVIADTAPAVTLQVWRAGTEDIATVPNDVMLGSPVSAPVRIGSVHDRRTIGVAIGSWPSGVYFIRLTSGARIGYAPFVLAPKRLGEHRIAVVMPTQTWQAYNFRDDNGDGHGDTWYAGWRTNKALLIRPVLDRGVPPHWKQYDAPFVRWIVHTHPDVDVISDAELRAVPNGESLAKAYTLMVFSGHHEYVTSHEYDVVTQYRNLGGNLMFLSANNFFWKITLDGAVMTRVAQWRDLGRPEAALIGVQYRGNDRGGHRGPWILSHRGKSSSLFAGRNIDEFGSGGIEIDATTPSSPRNIQVLAQIPELYGPTFTAQMTYYETAAGAKVFAAGAFTLAGAVWDPEIQPLVECLWRELSVG
ncbi:MAG: N,N-dimethylformamidase beta subunit family domain-containing protein [Gaiellaceae bacterium]